MMKQFERPKTVFRLEFPVAILSQSLEDNRTAGAMHFIAVTHGQNGTCDGPLECRKFQLVRKPKEPKGMKESALHVALSPACPLLGSPSVYPESNIPVNGSRVLG